MSRNGLREGILEIGRDPVFLVIELGWRWGFGAIAILVCGFSIFLTLDSVNVDPRRIEAIAALNPLQLAQDIVELISSLGAVLWRVVLAAGLVLAAIWVPFSALGRYATLSRPALARGANLQICIAVSVVRALLTLASIVAWFGAGLFAAIVASATPRSRAPNFGLLYVVLLLAFLVIVGVWSTLNWFFSLVALSVERNWGQSVLNTLRFVSSRRDDLLEISIVNGVLRAGLVVIAILLSVAASSVITNVRVLLADLLAIALLYFLVADFLYIARLIAFAKLRGEVVVRPPSAVFSHSDLTSNTGTQARAPLPHDAF